MFSQAEKCWVASARQLRKYYKLVTNKILIKTLQFYKVYSCASNSE